MNKNDNHIDKILLDVSKIGTVKHRVNRNIIPVDILRDSATGMHPIKSKFYFRKVNFNN